MHPTIVPMMTLLLVDIVCLISTPMRLKQFLWVNLRECRPVFTITEVLDALILRVPTQNHPAYILPVWYMFTWHFSLSVAAKGCRTGPGSSE